MSTAHLVPETWELTGDDAWKLLKSTGRRRLLADAFQRLRFADGFSHARSLAFMVTLTAIQGVIALAGFATAFGGTAITDTIRRVVEATPPGPVATLLGDAVSQATDAGQSHNLLGLALGSLGWLISATTAMGQLERGLNRLYGVEQDRDSVRKYGRALLLAASVGLLITAAFALLAFGRTVGATVDNEVLSRVWDALSWPLGVVLMAAGLALLFRWCPRRHQPAWSWLAFGSAVSLGLWALVTVGLGLFFRHSASFGTTYGPLAGMVAFMLWSVLTSVSLFFGASVAAQLEAVRADAASPQDDTKVQRSEPVRQPATAGRT